MEAKFSRIRQILFFIALAPPNIIIMKDNVVYPIAYIFYELFPEQAMGVNFLMSGLALFTVVSSLMVPSLIKYISKKTLLMISCIAFTVTSVGGALIPILPYMIICRAIGGLCHGVANVTAISIIADYYVDEEKRASFMGIYQAAMAVIGAVLGLVAGALAQNGWQTAFHTYWLAVPMTILVILFVPNVKSSAEDITQQETKSKQPYGRQFWIMMFDFTILSICYSIPALFFCSNYVTENALGDKLFVGILGSLTTFGSAVICMFFGILYKHLKSRTSLTSFALLIFSIGIMYFLPSKTTTIAAMTASGAAFGNIFTYVYAHGPCIVPPEKIDSSISLITAISSIAMFLCTYFETALMSLLQTSRVTDTLPVLLVMVLVTCILEIFNTGLHSK